MSAVADANRGDFTANPRVLVVTLMAVFIGVASAFVALVLTKLIATASGPCGSPRKSRPVSRPTPGELDSNTVSSTPSDATVSRRCDALARGNRCRACPRDRVRRQSRGRQDRDSRKEQQALVGPERRGALSRIARRGGDGGNPGYRGNRHHRQEVRAARGGHSRRLDGALSQSRSI